MEKGRGMTSLRLAAGALARHRLLPFCEPKVRILLRSSLSLWRPGAPLQYCRHRLQLTVLHWLKAALSSEEVIEGQVQS